MSGLSYKSYKRWAVEWLGKVPEHWEVIQLKRLASIKSGSDFKRIETSGTDGYPVIGSGGEFARATECIFTGESVLFGRKGTIDKPLYINGSFWVVDTMLYTVVDTNRVLPKYLYYCALTIRFDLYSTSTALPSMTQEDLGSIFFAIPSLVNQAAIVAFLDRKIASIDTLITAKQRLLNLLAEKRRALITQAVTKGLDLSVAVKDSGISWLGEMPAHWSIVALRRLISSLEQGWSPVASNQPADNHEFGVLKLSAIKSGRLIHEENKALASDAEIPAGLFIKKGDVFLTRANTPKLVGDVAVAGSDHDNIIFSDLIYRMRVCPEKIDPEWLVLVLLSDIGRGQIEAEAKGSSNSMVKLAQDQVLGLLVPVPPKSEQEAIIVHVQAETQKLTNLTAATERTIKLLQERRAALISDAVTGKIPLESMNLSTEASHAN